MGGRSQTANSTDARKKSAAFLRPRKGNLKTEIEANSDHCGRQAREDRAKKRVD